MAQEKKISTFLMGKKDTIQIERIENYDSLKFVVDSLQKVLFYHDSINNENVKMIDSLRHKVKTDSIRYDVNNVTNKRQADSLLSVIKSKDKEIATLRADIGFVDTCMVKLANRWLYEPFDKNDVDEAISYFDRIYSSRLKEDLSIVQELLRDYEPSHREFQSLIKEAQDDFDRTSPFACEEYKNNYIQKIKDMTYYSQYYKKDWNIKYLNKQIDKALEILNNHKKDEYADFDCLIDK